MQYKRLCRLCHKNYGFPILIWNSMKTGQTHCASSQICWPIKSVHLLGFRFWLVQPPKCVSCFSKIFTSPRDKSYTHSSRSIHTVYTTFLWSVLMNCFVENMCKIFFLFQLILQWKDPRYHSHLALNCVIKEYRIYNSFSVCNKQQTNLLVM
jgi:hypothetical protein